MAMLASGQTCRNIADGAGGEGGGGGGGGAGHQEQPPLPTIHPQDCVHQFRERRVSILAGSGAKLLGRLRLRFLLVD